MNFPEWMKNVWAWMKTIGEPTPAPEGAITWEQAKTEWKAADGVAHIIKRKLGGYLVQHHPRFEWCPLCDAVYDWGFPDHHEEK